jgi:flagellar hook-basal body complex protein FliE
MPIDPTFAVRGAEWNVGLGDAAVPGAAPAEGAPASGGGFGNALTEQIGKLEETQAQAAEHSGALAAGTSTDPAAAVMAVERARLSMQLASQIRTKAVDAIQDIFHTQV